MSAGWSASCFELPFHAALTRLLCPRYLSFPSHALVSPPFPFHFRQFTHLTSPPRYYANTNNITWPPEVQDYNNRFTKLLEHIKSRHDPTVTTVAQGVLEWKRSQNAKHIGLDIQAWLDRFYLSRIGIRFLIGQRELSFCFPSTPLSLSSLLSYNIAFVHSFCT